MLAGQYATQLACTVSVWALSSSCCSWNSLRNFSMFSRQSSRRGWRDGSVRFYQALIFFGDFWNMGAPMDPLSLKCSKICIFWFPYIFLIVVCSAQICVCTYAPIRFASPSPPQKKQQWPIVRSSCSISPFFFDSIDDTGPLGTLQKICTI